jgi:hypothetical protein
VFDLAQTDKDYLLMLAIQDFIKKLPFAKPEIS